MTPAIPTQPADTAKPASDSQPQRDAEAAIIETLASQLVPDLAASKRILVGAATVQVDARSADDRLLVEVYARQGALKPGQRNKVAKDILKLALLRQQPEFAESRAIIAFASQEARDSITGWIADAANQFGIELLVVEIPEELRAELLTAQARQAMTNIASSALSSAPTKQSNPT
ncbi:MAG: hypothetical protein FWD83_02805 [Promicromonosporaceae bacterium]|nr:hypothetical protein [Promicromonosporaceae bacterium]